MEMVKSSLEETTKVKVRDTLSSEPDPANTTIRRFEARLVDFFEDEETSDVTTIPLLTRIINSSKPLPQFPPLNKMESQIEVQKDELLKVDKIALLNDVAFMKDKVDALSEEYVRLANTAEIAIESKKVAIECMNEQSKIADINGERAALLQLEINHLEKAYLRLESEFKLLKSKSDGEKEKDTILESQRNQDREDFFEQVKEYNRSLKVLELENADLKEDRVTVLEGLPKREEYFELLAALSLSEDSTRIQDGKIQAQNALIKSLEAQASQQENLMKSHLKQIKTLIDSTLNLNKDKIAKDLKIKDQKEEVALMQARLEAIGKKSKLNSKSIHAKNLQIRTMKMQIKESGAKTTEVKSYVENLESITAENNEFKLALVRKQSIITKLTSQLQAAKDEVSNVQAKGEQTKKNLNNTIRSNINETVKLSQELKQCKSRESQFTNAIYRYLLSFEGSAIDVPPGLDASEVSKIATKLSKDILDLDWTDISSPYSLIETFQEIILVSEFENQLLELLDSTF